MNLAKIVKKNWQHIAVIALFFILMFLYFMPEFDGYSLKQHDVEQFKGMSNEIVHHREKFDEEPLWTNAMFGGMPAAQISVLYQGNIFQKSIIGFLRFFGVPSGIFLLHLIGFYILALCLRVRPLVAFIGAVAFAFATYEIVIIQAGHNSKATTVALMAPVLGAFIMAYRKNWKWGVVLSALFMCFEVASNHLQVTYYLGILLLGLGIFEFVKAFRAKKIKHFFIVSGLLLGAYGLALFVNYGNLTITREYAKHTIRGGNDLTINPDGTEAKKNTDGLDKDYITTWSYGVGESFTLISPYVKGSASVGLADSNFKDLIEDSDRTRSEKNAIYSAPFPIYFGEQPIVSGPTYIGIVLFLIMLMGLVFLEDKRKWVFFAVGVLALLLSWGKNFMGLTEFFIDYIPGYNKFRTVTIIMVLIELVSPVIAVLFLESMFKNREVFVEKKKQFAIVSGVCIVFLIGLKFVGLGDNYSSSADRVQIERVEESVLNQLKSLTPEQLTQNRIDLSNEAQVKAIVNGEMEKSEEQLASFKTARKDIFHNSMNRSIGFSILTLVIFALYFYTSIQTIYVIAGLGLLLMIDLIPVNRNYLNSDELKNGKYKHWMPIEDLTHPMSITGADQQIMDMESLDPKVLTAIEEGKKAGEVKALALEYNGASKNRVVNSYKFSALNFATNYRVFTYDNPWGSTKASYFHKNLGGYHGAKLRNIQNLYEFQLANGNNKMFDMLNVKYFLQGPSARPNPTAMGNVWFVKSIKEKETPNDEIRALGTEFSIENRGKGRLVVNDESVKVATVFGREKMIYLLPGQDTIPVQLSNGMSKGMEAILVQDVNGQTNLVPAVTLSIDTSNSFTSLVSIKVVDTFDPYNESVMLSSEAKKLSQKVYSGEGIAKMTMYKANQIDYDIELNEKQLAVFSEIYYPHGWKAIVDGNEQDILKVNYLLRGLELEKGKHKVSFIYEIPKYNISNVFSIIGTLFLFLIVGFGFWKFSPFDREEIN
ncbi:MAG: YfhO family protein [Flavobacteriales bacterium]|nr:YfhO family protein [Flavobacteriales bacterium]